MAENEDDDQGDEDGNDHGGRGRGNRNSKKGGQQRKPSTQRQVRERFLEELSESLAYSVMGGTSDHTVQGLMNFLKKVFGSEEMATMAMRMFAFFAPVGVTTLMAYVAKESLLAEMGAEGIDGALRGFVSRLRLYQQRNKLTTERMEMMRAVDPNPAAQKEYTEKVLREAMAMSDDKKPEAKKDEGFKPVAPSRPLGVSFMAACSEAAAKEIKDENVRIPALALIQRAYGRADEDAIKDEDPHGFASADVVPLVALAATNVKRGVQPLDSLELAEDITRILKSRPKPFGMGDAFKSVVDGLRGPQHQPTRPQDRDTERWADHYVEQSNKGNAEDAEGIFSFIIRKLRGG